MARHYFLFILTFFIFSTFAVTYSHVYAQNLKLIRDSEIENTIRSYAKPLLKAAGLPESSVHIHIVNDNRINAFVFDGLNIFINTGLLLKSENLGEIIGVLAHEIGHLEGAHLARTKTAIKNASNKGLITQILGALTAIGSKNSSAIGDASRVIIMAGSATAQNHFLSYSRSQEQAADQASLKYLDKTKQSARGLMQLLKRLKKQELLNSNSQNPLIRTHPVTQERIRLVAKHIQTSPYSNKPYSAEQITQYQRMKGKLKAFILPPNEILTNIDPEETGFINQYTRAISLYRTSELELSLSIINQLIKKFPQDPWFRELKGQFLFETGHIEESIQPYIKAVALAPRAPLLRLGLARAQIETNKEINLIAAIRNLKVASQIEADYPPFWYFLGVAFGRLEMFADADLALAEYALIRGQNKKSMHHAKRAYSALGKGSPQSQRALDIINLIENKL